MADTNWNAAKGQVVLIVEDEALIALDMAETLEEAGFTVMGPAATVEQALALLDFANPDAAVLDLNLGGEWSTPVMLALQEREVPFLIASGQSLDAVPDEPALRRAARIWKPAGSQALVGAVSGLVAH